MIAIIYLACLVGFLFFKFRGVDATGSILYGFVYFGLPVSAIAIVAVFLCGLYGH